MTTWEELTESTDGRVVVLPSATTTRTQITTREIIKIQRKPPFAGNDQDPAKPDRILIMFPGKTLVISTEQDDAGFRFDTPPDLEHIHSVIAEAHRKHGGQR